MKWVERSILSLFCMVLDQRESEIRINLIVTFIIGTFEWIGQITKTVPGHYHY